MIRCPICNGKGEIETPKCLINKKEAYSIMAKSLKKEGYSIRQTMKLMGYKSPRSIQVLLK